MKILTRTFFKECVFALILLSGLALLYIGAMRYPLSIDLTTNQHTLSETSQSLIKQFTQPLQITLFSESRDQYQSVRFLIERYQRLQSNVNFQWQRKNLTLSDQLEQESLQVKYRDQQQIINLQDSPLNEAIFTSALFKLQRKVNEWIVFLQGHDEPSLYGKRHRDFSLLRLSLQNQGHKLQSLDLTKTPVIADNVQLLVLASPKSKYSAQEEALSMSYLARGGDLLWLVDPSAEKSTTLGTFFGVEFLVGTVIDLHGQKLGTSHPAITIIEHYPNLPFSAPATLMALPFSCAMLQQDNPTWQAQHLLTSDEMSWTESQISGNKMAFEPEKGEVAGPLTLGLSLTRTHPKQPESQQRIAIIGNSRFLSNGAIENYGNLAFALNMINWLAHDDMLMHMTQPTAQDTMLSIHLPIAIWIQYGAPSVALIACICMGAYHLRRRRKSHKMSALLSRTN